MKVLEDLEPKSVFRYFEELCGIPHGSENMKPIGAYCMKFAKERSLECHQDAAGNVVIIKEATKGYEAAPTLIIQGHLDMVCEKTPECTIDFMKDGLELMVEGDYISAKGTTLGGDNGIAVAMALAILDGKDMKHPRLEALFTVDEEIGLLGADALDASLLKGKMLLNVDSEDEGIITVSCAGGITADCYLPVSRRKVTGECCKLSVCGLRGGHSGAEIHKQRGNSNMLMGRVLNTLSSAFTFNIEELSGGLKDNAIPKETTAVVYLTKGDMKAFEKAVADCGAVLGSEYKSADPGLSVSFEALGKKEALVLDEKSTQNAVFLLLNLPNGVQAMSMEIPGLVETSLNLGVLMLEMDVLHGCYAVRSSVQTAGDALNDRLVSMWELFGGKVEFSGSYPAWEYKKDSKFRDAIVRVYEDKYNKSPGIEAIHAGLECGILSGKIEGLDCVSIGPSMQDVHTTDEKLSISSVASTFDFIKDILAAIK